MPDIDGTGVVNGDISSTCRLLIGSSLHSKGNWFISCSSMILMAY